MGIERLPPYDHDAERIVIGSALQDPDTAKALEHLPVDAFYASPHRKVWSAVLESIKAEGWVDAAVIGRLLRGQLDILEEVRACLEAVEIPVYGVRHARRVLELYRRRLAIRSAYEVVESGDDAPLEDILASLDRARESLIEGAGSIAMASGWAKAIVPGVEKEMTEPRPDESEALSYGFRSLDLLNAHVRPGDYHIIAGWPGQGKSTFVTEWAFRTAARTGKPIIYVSLEMRPELVVRRALVAAAGISDPGPREATEQEKASLASARGWVEACPVLVPQMFPRKLGSFLSWAREVSAEVHPAAMIVDHIGYLKGQGKSLYERTTDVTRSLRSWAAEGSRVPVIALSQLSREGRREGRPPQLHDLRDSGALEEDACLMMAVFHPWGMTDDDGQARLLNRSPSAKTDAWLYVLKNREGQTGRVPAYFDGGRGTFRAKA